MLSMDAFFDEQAVRTLAHTQFGGAARNIAAMQRKG
jgi:hypothetical protein